MSLIREALVIMAAAPHSELEPQGVGASDGGLDLGCVERRDDQHRLRGLWSFKSEVSVVRLKDGQKGSVLRSVDDIVDGG